MTLSKHWPCQCSLPERTQLMSTIATLYIPEWMVQQEDQSGVGQCLAEAVGFGRPSFPEYAQSTY